MRARFYTALISEETHHCCIVIDVVSMLGCVIIGARVFELRGEVHLQRNGPVDDFKMTLVASGEGSGFILKCTDF